MSALTAIAVQTPAPAEHPSVGAPKCVDCRHHRVRERSKGWAAADLCAHPLYSRSLITGEPTQICADLRGVHMVSAEGLPPCGPAGTLYQAAEDDGAPVVTRSQLATALTRLLAAEASPELRDSAVADAHQLLDQLAAEVQP